MSYQPPFDITSKIINQISAIAEQVGRLGGHGLTPSPQLRKQNRIRTIQERSTCKKFGDLRLMPSERDVVSLSWTSV